MTKKWSEVASSEGFKALPPDAQDSARRQYFEQVVAPQVPEEHVDKAWNQFSTDAGVGRRELPAGVSASSGHRSAQDPRRLDAVQPAQPEATSAQGQTELSDVAKANAVNAKVSTEFNRLKAINPGVSDDRIAALAGERYKNSIEQTPSAPQKSRAELYSDKGYTPENAQANAVFDAGVQDRLNRRAQTVAPDERGDRVSIPYDPNVDAAKTAADAKNTDQAQEAVQIRQNAQSVGPVIAGLAKGYGQAQGFGQAVIGFAGDAIGNEDVKKWGIDAYNDTMRKVGNMAVAKDFTDLRSADDAATYLAETLSYGAFQAAQAIATGGLGGAAGKLVGQKVIGEVVGLAVGNVAQELGSIYGDAQEEAARTGKPAPSLWQVAAMASAAAAIDTVADKMGWDAVTVQGQKRSVLQRIGSALQQPVIQGGTEMAQKVPEEIGAGKDPFREGTLKDYINEGAAGAVMGGGPGVVSALRPDAKPTEPNRDPAGLAKSKGFLVREEQIKSLRDAGEDAAADLLQKKHDKQTTIENVDGEIARLPGNADFAQQYRDLRINGLKPAEAAARSAVTVTYKGLAQASGVPDKAMAAALEQAKTMPLDKVPGFLHKFTEGLAKRGLIQPNEATAAVGTSLEAARDDAMESAISTVYQPVKPMMDAVQALESEQFKPGPGGVSEPVSATLQDKTGAPFEVTRAFRGRYDFTVDGKEAGSILYTDMPSGGFKVTGVDVKPEFQRRGVATSVYDFLESQVIKEPFKNAGARSEAGEAFRADRSSNNQPQAPAEPAQAATETVATPAQEIDLAAHDAATSPLNSLPEPTQAQKEAGNYKVGRVNLHGLNISIENPEGSVRKGTSPDGSKWENTLAAHYGYIRGTEGNDGDHVDTFIGPNPESRKVFVVDQVNKDGSFDEHKVMLGVDSLQQADDLYHANYHEGWTGRGAITEMPMDQFKEWVKDGTKTQPVGQIATPDSGTKEAGGTPEVQSTGGAGPSASADKVVYLGRDNVPLTEGGKAFKTRKAADDARKLNTLMRVVRTEGGYALTEKTPAQIAAQEKAAKRLRTPQTSAKGEPIPAHAFIASEGGLSGDNRSDMGMQGNIQIGNRKLFAGEGKGLSIERATERLIETGYLPEGAGHDHARDLIKRSLTKPQYNADGYERLAELDSMERFTSAQEAYDDAVAEVEALSDNQFDALLDADIPWESPSNTSTEAAMKALGFTDQEIQDATANQPGEPQDGSESRGVADEGVTSQAQADTGRREETPAEPEKVTQPQTPAPAGVSVSTFDATLRADGTLAVKGDAAAIREALKDIPAKSMTAMKGGILVGKTQADKAMAILQPAELTAPTKEEVVARQDQAEQTAKNKEKTDRAADKLAREDEDRKRIAKASEAAADTFELGGDAMANLTGQKDIFAEEPVGKQDPVKIDDVGEKIGGARKDTAVSTGVKRRAATEDDSRPTWAKRFKIAQVAGGFDMSVNGRDISGKWTISDLRNKDRYDQPKRVGEYFDTKEAAESALPLIAVAQKHRVSATGQRNADGGHAFEIWRDVNDRKRVKVVDREFASREEAMQYMAKHATEILETNTTFGEADLPKPDNTGRTGVERRTGDVKGEDFRDTFGFRGVEFGLWNNQDERQEVMNAAYDGLMDLADVLKVPPKAIGLNGDLALAFGARGKGLSGARAHYETDRVVMNLTKMNGAGALAHEWFHALDHYLARQDGKTTAEWKINKDGTRSLDVRGGDGDMASSGFLRNNSGVREELRAAYTSLVQSLFTKAEQYVEDTARADKFVSVARGELQQDLDKLRKDLAEQKDVRYYKRNNKPASAEQLAEFDSIAAELVEGRGLSTEWKSMPGKNRLSIQTRHTNETLEKLNELYKAVRGRSGFNAEHRGVLDALAGYMKRYDQRLQMLREATALTTKTKRVPTSFAMDAKSLDQGRGGDYWTSPHEMVARAFQGYVEDAIAAKEGRSPFLNYAPENAGILTPWGAKRPYPAGAERKAMNSEFEKFIDVLETKETDKGVAMFARGTNGAVTNPNDVVGNQGGRSADDSTPGVLKDASGKPIVVYHGTSQAFDKFHAKHISSGMYGEGFYFTNLKEDAELYSQGGRVIEANLTIKNPASREIAEEVANRIGEDDYMAIREELQRMGFDGVVAKGDYAGEVIYVAFRPDQIQQNESTAPDNGGAFSRGKAQTESDAFKKWFGDSKVVDSDGKPLVVYHGTMRDFSTFDLDASAATEFTGAKAIYLSPDRSVSNEYADGRGGNVMPVYVKAEKPFDYSNPQHVAAVAAEVEKTDPAGPNGAGIASGQYGILEKKSVQDAIKKLGFDAFYVEERGEKNIGVFKPTQVKSATGNNGNFDPANPDIRYALGADAFRLGVTPRKFMPVADVQKTVDQLTAKWKDGPKVKVVLTPDELPLEAPSDARGLIHKGTAYIVAANHVDRNGVARTLGHEAIGHYGLWKLLGADGTRQFERNVQLALKSGNVPLTKIAARVRSLYVDENGKFNLSPREEANEIAAFAVEEALDADGNFKPGFGFLKQIWAKIAAFLRDIGIDVEFTHAELHGMLVSAMKGLEAGHRLEGRAQGLVAAARDAGNLPEQNALREISGNDEMFQYPVSYMDTVEGITAEIAPHIKVRKLTNIPGETRYVFQTPDGNTQRMMVRPHNPYANEDAPTIYGYDLDENHEMTGIVTERPGKNPEYADGKDDVFVDVALMRPGERGAAIYAIAANYAHNTGKVFIGDPSGLSDHAMKRRVEQMLSSALKFGTTDHLAPHPRQVKGDMSIGVPALNWTYGDDLGNIKSLIRVSNAIYGNDNPITFEPVTGRYLDSEGVELDDDAISLAVRAGRGGAPGIGMATAKRNAVLSALVSKGNTGSDSTRGRDQLLEKLLDVGREFPAATSRIFYARGVNPGLFTPTIWETPAPTRTDKVIYELQDGRIDLKRVQEAITKSGQQIEEKWDARLAETVYPGRVAYRSHEFLKTEVKPLLKSMAVHKATMAELADYLHARGAEERNKQVAKVNPSLPDGGAGKNSQGVLMTNQAARDYLDAISPTRKQVLDALASKVDAITAGTRQLLVTEGLEKQETIGAWMDTYKNYVPMFRDEAQSGTPHPQGSGFSVKGSASKRATGSTKEVTNILAHVLMQREAAITRAEKNRVAVSLYGQALSHPNPEFWTTIKPSMTSASIATELQAMGIDPMTATIGMEMAPTITTVDPNTGKKVDRPNPMYKSLPGAIPLKVNGEDRVLMINTENERGARMAENLKNLDGLTKLDLANSIVGKATRWLASVNTQYNPAFGLTNLTRDTLGAAVNLGSTELRGHSLEVLAKTPVAIVGIARELMSGNQSGKWQTLYRQFQADGGQTGWKENFRDAGDRAKAIESELAGIQRGMLSPGRAAHAILDVLDGFNTTLENAVRLSAYSAALDAGISRAEAARLGRELTVDFNRKGRMGREAGPLYAFFNASVQGTARTMEAVNGPTGAKIIAGGLAIGTIQALMLLAAGYDDDEVPEFVKTRSLVIPTNWTGKGDKKHVLIPYPLGLHVIPNTGRVITELSLNGAKDIGARSFAAIGEIAGAFNPLGGGNIFTADGALKTAAPTLVDPLIEIGFNKNFAGNNIERPPYKGETDTRPGVARTKESTQRSTTGQVYMGISKAINAMTGGTDYEAGKLSPTPERLRYIAQTVGGGVLRELEKGINASTAANRGEKVKMSQIPVAGRFYGEVDADQVKTSRYFDASAKLDKLETTKKTITKAADPDALEKLMKDHPEIALVNLGNKVQSAVAKLNKAAVMTIDDPEGLKAIDENRVQVMDVLNQAVEELESQTQKPTVAAKIKGWRKEAVTQ